MPQVNDLGLEKNCNNKKFEIQISVQRSNNKLDYLVTLPSFVI